MKFNNRKKLKTFRIEGGLGKHIVFTSLIKPLFDKFGKINIISSYDDIFSENEYVENSWSAAYFDQNRDELKEFIDEILFHEPYKTDFGMVDSHINESWGKAFGVEPEDLPSFTADIKTLETSINFRKNLGKYFIVQFSGGQPPLEFNSDNPYMYNHLQLARNYPHQMGSIFIGKLKQKFPDYTIVDFTLPNEPKVNGCERLILPYTGYKELCSGAADIICIDSSLAHIAAVANKSAIVLWNTNAEGKPNNYGWSIHKNIEAPDLTIDYDFVLKVLEERFNEPIPENLELPHP